MFCHYYVKPDPAKFGHFGANAQFAVPSDLKKPQNIYMHDYARVGPKSTIMTMGESKFVMKEHSCAAEGLVVITSNHYQRKGTFHYSGNSDNIYLDVIVEEDVWLGMNVTLLPGAHIGRGAIVGAGAVVRDEIPPYAIASGNPARVTGFKYSVKGILKHEAALYPEDKRFTSEELEKIVATVKNED